MATKQEIIEHIHIPSLIRELLPSCKQAGQEFSCLCPFHNDHNPSLSVNPNTGNFKCFACGARGSIFDLYGQVNGLDFKGSITELAHRAGVSRTKENNVAITEKPKEVDRHDYHDASGNLLYQRVRLEPGDNGRSKKYFFFDPVTEKWKRPCDPILYNLPEVLNAPTVIICEGERKADVLKRWGLVGTSFDSGANSRITKEMIDVLTGKDLVVLPDNDDSGREYRDKIVEAMQGKAASIKVLDLPGLAEKGDIVDWIKTSGNNKELLLDLINREPQWQPTEFTECLVDTMVDTTVIGTVACEAPDILTDQRIKNYFNNCFKDIVRYVPGIGWHQWDGRRWCTNMPGGLHPLIDGMQRYLMAEADKITNEKERIDRKKSLIGLESHSRQLTVIQACQHVPELITNANELDRDGMLLNCLNGTIDLRTGALKPHNPTDRITRIVNVEYNQSAACPTFLAFITWAMCDNMELVAYLQRFIGYCLTGKTTEQILAFLYGTGSNGKTTLMNVVQWLLYDYAATADTSLIMKHSNGGDNNRLVMLAGLRGARVVTLSEVNDGEKLDEAAIKSYTGGDIITCRHLYQSFFSYVPQAKLIGFGNYKPHVRGTDNGIWRRIHLVPFNAVIADDAKDKFLPEKLRAELPGILAWAVRGCLEWQQIGLAPPTAILDAVKEYRQEEDVFQSWLKECCTLHETARTSASALIRSFKDYSGWSRMSERKFGDMLKERGFKKKRSNGVYWLGISLDLEQLEPLRPFSEKSYRINDIEGFNKNTSKVPTVPFSFEDSFS